MDIIEIKMHQSVLTASAGFGTGTQPGGNAAAPEFDFMPETMPGMPSFVFE